MGANQWTGLNDNLSLAGIKYWRAAWANATQYVQGDGVRGVDGSAYVCIQEHLSSAANTPNTGGSYLTFWSLLVTSITGAPGATGPVGPVGPQGNPGPGGGTNIGFEVVVAADGTGNYLTVTAAFAAGYRKMFVKAGTYSMPALTSALDDVYIRGDDWQNVILQTTASGAASVGFTFTGARVRIENITLRGTNALTTELVLKLNADFPRIDNVHIDKGLHNLIDGGNGKNGVISNCFLDATGMDPAYGGAPITGFGPLMTEVNNCYIYIPITVNYYVSYNANVVFNSCFIVGNKLILTGISVNNCFIQTGNLQAQCPVTNCHISDGLFSTGATAFITVNGSIFCNNVVDNSYNPAELIKVNNFFAVVNSNHMFYGHTVTINGEGVSFQNNVWTSTFYAQNNSIELTAAAKRCQVNFNIVKGEASSLAPVINDAGTNNNKISNQLYV